MAAHHPHRLGRDEESGTQPALGVKGDADRTTARIADHLSVGARQVEEAARLGLPVFGGRAPGHLEPPAALGAGDRPIVAFGRHLCAGDGKAVPLGAKGRERDHRALALGLARDRVGDGGHERVDAGGGRGLAGPMHGGKDLAALHLVCDEGPQEGRSVSGGDPHEAGRRDRQRRRVLGMDLDEGLGEMRRQPRRARRAGHRVPLVADTPGVEAEGEATCGLLGEVLPLHRHHAGAATLGVKRAVAKEPPALARSGVGPAEGRERVVCCV